MHARRNHDNDDDEDHHPHRHHKKGFLTFLSYFYYLQVFPVLMMQSVINVPLYVFPQLRDIMINDNNVGEWGWGVEGKQVGSMDEESQVRGCYNITFICTPTNQETV